MIPVRDRFKRRPYSKVSEAIKTAIVFDGTGYFPLRVAGWSASPGIGFGSVIKAAVGRLWQ